MLNEHHRPNAGLPGRGQPLVVSKLQQDVLLKISKTVAGHNVEIEYPTSTLHMPELAQVAANAAQSG